MVRAFTEQRKWVSNSLEARGVARVVRPEKPFAIEMDQMRRRVGDPDFSFPGNVVEVIHHRPAVEERRDEHEACGRILEEPIQHGAALAVVFREELHHGRYPNEHVGDLALGILALLLVGEVGQLVVIAVRSFFFVLALHEVGLLLALGRGQPDVSPPIERAGKRLRLMHHEPPGEREFPHGYSGGQESATFRLPKTPAASPTIADLQVRIRRGRRCGWLAGLARDQTTRSYEKPNARPPSPQGKFVSLGPQRAHPLLRRRMVGDHEDAFVRRRLNHSAAMVSSASAVSSSNPLLSPSSSPGLM